MELEKEWIVERNNGVRWITERGTGKVKVGKN